MFLPVPDIYKDMEKDKRKVVIVIQARMQSTRLPGKVLKKVLDKPLLFYLIERLRSVANADRIVVATTQSKADDAIASYCKRNDIIFYRGDEKDVLGRYCEAAKKNHADIVVRITADCPLIDPAVVDKVIKFFLDHNFDYVGNTLSLTFPRGMDTEVFSMKTLEEADLAAKLESEREHVTLYIYRHPERFKLANVSYVQDKSDYRLTVDTKEDFDLIKKIIEKLYTQNPDFTLEDILNLLEKNPKLSNINCHVAQKQIKEK
jgi:spore coat polysaccharide biosynthesis protein SpsF